MLNNELKKEVIYMCIGVPVLSAVMVIIFALCGIFDSSVLFGALLGTGVTLLNYYLLALSVQRAGDKEIAEAKNLIKLSYTLRIIMIAVVIIVAIRLPYFNNIATILPLLFERIVIMAVHFREKKV